MFDFCLGVRREVMVSVPREPNSPELRNVPYIIMLRPL